MALRDELGYRRRMASKRAFPIVLCVLLLAAAAPHSWAGTLKGSVGHHSRYEILKGHNVKSTPDEYELDVMPVMKHWYGGKKPSTPKVVMVLVPGFFGGTENFAYTGERLVERFHRMQVWVVERRNNLLENRCGMEHAQKSGYSATQLMALYYLSGSPSFTGCPEASDEADPNVWDGVANEHSLSQTEAADVGMADWGLETELKDIRAVVRDARKEYPNAKVVLGGHSLGGMTTQLYAGWRFGRKASSAGWKTIDGVVLIDGAVNGPGWTDEMVPQSFATRAMTEAGQFYWDDLDGGPILGLLAEFGALAAIQSPDVESFIWTSLVPPLTWPFANTCPTNRAAFAALTDDQYGFSSTFELHQGDVSGPLPGPLGGTKKCSIPNQTRDLVGWLDFDEVVEGQQEISSTDVWAHSMVDSTATNGVEWYFSTVLSADIDLASNLDATAEYTHEDMTTTAEAAYGLREFDTAAVKVPVYGFIASFCRANYDWYKDQATSVASFRYVDRSAEHCSEPSGDPYGHVDPLFAADEGGHTNDFFATLVKWVKEKVL